VEERKQKLIENIKENYRRVEKSIVNQLHMRNDLHGSTIGSAREDIWEQIFHMIIPKKFVIERSVFIIDSEGNISREVDLAILDEMYTPYIFRYGRLKFIPIEAVVVVVECKSKDLRGVGKWIQSIEKLRTANESIARTATYISIESPSTQKSTRPIRILCLLDSIVNWKIAKKFDFVLLAVKEQEKNEANNEDTVRIDVQVNTDKTLFEWYKELNFHRMDMDELPDKVLQVLEDAKTHLEGLKLSKYEVRDQKASISLLTFNFQLNQLLMLINNPIPFPHRNYVRLFNGWRADA